MTTRTTMKHNSTLHEVTNDDMPSPFSGTVTKLIRQITPIKYWKLLVKRSFSTYDYKNNHET